MEAQIVALKEAVAKAEAIGEQRRLEADAARKQIAGMAVEIEALSKQTVERFKPNATDCEPSSTPTGNGSAKTRADLGAMAANSAASRR